MDKRAGVLIKVTEWITGYKKDNSGTWEKQGFVLQTNEKHNNIYYFEVFGEDKVRELQSNFNIGDRITVDFYISCKEYSGKYFTTLQAFKITHQ
jgi:hypothetical protein